MHRELHDGRIDGLHPLKSLDLEKIETFEDLILAMSETAFNGRQIGRAFKIFLEMINNPDCSVIMTLSGAMTVAKQGLIISQLIDRGYVQAIVSTGALIAHGLTESIGLTHYAVDQGINDETLFKKGYNRIYDTLEMESNLNNVADLVSNVLDEYHHENKTWSSAEFCRLVGKKLDNIDEGPGILRSAYHQNIPVFIPAFTDSEVGLDFSTWVMKKSNDPVFHATPDFNPFMDLQKYARLIGSANTLGIFTIGGGVPRNWAQQVAPYYDITSDRLGIELKSPKFQYGIRICPESPHWGGLSGCTYSEGVSWGKFVSPQNGGRYAEIYADATIVLPILMKAIFEVMDMEK